MSVTEGRLLELGDQAGLAHAGVAADEGGDRAPGRGVIEQGTQPCHLGDEQDGRGTGRRILLYSLGLIPVSLAPTFLGMSGTIYAIGAIVMGIAYCYFGARLAQLGLPMSAPPSKQRARQLLRASIIYLPLLFALMMINGVK